MKKQTECVKDHDSIYRMHWGGAQNTLSGQVMLMVHDIGTDCIFQVGKDI